MDDFCIAGLGELLWDILPEGKKVGGAPANFAFHCRNLKSDGVVATRIGDDELGREMLARLDELGLEKTFVQTDRKHPTGTVTVELDEKGIPSYDIHEGVAWDYIESAGELMELAGRVDAVCFGSLAQRNSVSAETIHRFLEKTRQDCLRVFDINLRQSYFSRGTIESSLELADVFKLNDEELEIIAEMFDIKGSESQILAGLVERFGLRLVALTKGDKGSKLFTADSENDCAGVDASIVDTVGAGDSFTAAVTVGLLKGVGLAEINERANRIAAFVCSQAGATPCLPGELVY